MTSVVVLNDYCYINGGASKIAIDEALSLANAGLRVIFLGATGPVCDALQQSSVEVVCLNQPELLNVGSHPSVMFQGLWNHKAFLALGDILDKLDPHDTVVHLHGYTKSLTTSVVACAAKRRFPIICTLHDFFAACPNGAQFDYVEARPCKRRCLSVQCVAANCDKRHYVHKLYRVVRSFTQRLLGRFPASVTDYIPLSRFSAQILRPYLPKRSRLHPLENLIEVEKMPAVDVAANKAVVAVGRLDVEKGIKMLLEAASAANVSLTLVGDGPLRALAETYSNVRVTGWVSPQRVQAELRNARCLVFPSLWYETYGLVVSEAAAFGVPAIVSDVSAASERIDHGVHGWHFRSGSIDDLVVALWIIKDDAAVRSAGTAAYERFWRNPPTRSNHVTGLIDIYQGVLNEWTGA